MVTLEAITTDLWQLETGNSVLQVETEGVLRSEETQHHCVTPPSGPGTTEIQTAGVNHTLSLTIPAPFPVSARPEAKHCHSLRHSNSCN